MVRHLRGLSWPLLGAVLVFGLPTAVAAEPTSKVFRDWVAGCDNLRQCTALSLPGELDDRMAYVRLQRGGGPTDAPSLSLQIRDIKLKKAFEARLTLDGAPFPAAGRNFPGASPDGEVGTIELPAQDADALIAAARKATKLGIGFDGKSFTISLSGTIAALLWIDEQQGRLGTVTALIRKGDKPATAVPAPPPLPVITAQATSGVPGPDEKAAKTLAAKLRAHLKRAEPDTCDDRPESGSNMDNVWVLGLRRHLVGLLCYQGAYNMGSAYWIVEQDKVAAARRIAFPTPSGKPQDDLVNSAYDPKSGLIDFFSKGRGPADCGSSGIYAWTGSAFVLTSWNEMSVCRGLPPDEWISLFRSETRFVK